MTTDDVFLLLNGAAYVGLALAYTATNARYEHRIWGAQLAGFVSIVFGILFFFRAFGIENSVGSPVTWTFRIGVLLFVLGNAATLRTLTTPDHTMEVHE